jgi:hypothetical protein
MVSRPTRGTSLRLTASSATRRTVQRARPSGGLLHTIAIKRCFWLSSRTSGCSGSLFLIQRPIQTALPIPSADIADGLCCQRNYPSNAGRDGAFGQLQQRQGAQHDTNLLDSATHQFPEFLGRHFNAQGWTSHALN